MTGTQGTGGDAREQAWVRRHGEYAGLNVGAAMFSWLPLGVVVLAMLARRGAERFGLELVEGSA